MAAVYSSQWIDKLIIGNLMVSGEGLDAHVKTGGESSTRISKS